MAFQLNSDKFGQPVSSVENGQNFRGFTSEQANQTGKPKKERRKYAEN